MMAQPTYRSRRILLPARRGFIALSLAVALMLNFFPLGYVVGLPDWAALVLLFWAVREPFRIGMGTAFVMGLFMDVVNSAVVGQHALAYVLLAYMGSRFSRRILWFPFGSQALHVFPLLCGMQAVMLVVRVLAGAAFPGWNYFMGSIVATLLWHPLTYMLLLPQYRSVEKDENRPI